MGVTLAIRTVVGSGKIGNQRCLIKKRIKDDNGQGMRGKAGQKRVQPFRKITIKSVLHNLQRFVPFGQERNSKTSLSGRNRSLHLLLTEDKPFGSSIVLTSNKRL